MAQDTAASASAVSRMQRGKTLVKRNKRMKQKNQSGFSLLEMLVVIAIVLMLVALFLPMTLRLEDAVNVKIDINNYRRIYTALYAYAEDNKGHMPFESGIKALGWCPTGNWTAGTGCYGFWKKHRGYSENECKEYCGSGSVDQPGLVRSVCQRYDDGFASKTPDTDPKFLRCHSPRASGRWSFDDDYSYSGFAMQCQGSGPWGGMVIGTHNPRKTIIACLPLVGMGHGLQDGIWFSSSVVPDPFMLKGTRFGNPELYSPRYVPHKHMANIIPRLRLDGVASGAKFNEDWGNWPGGGYDIGSGGY